LNDKFLETFPVLCLFVFPFGGFLFRLTAVEIDHNFLAPNLNAERTDSSEAND